MHSKPSLLRSARSALARVKRRGKQFVQSALRVQDAPLTPLWLRYSYDAMILAHSFDFAADDIEKSVTHGRSFARSFDRIKTINWFIPEFEHAAYGGIQTILRFAAHFHRKRNVENRFFVVGSSMSLEKIRKAIGEAFPELQTAAVVRVGSEEDLQNLPAADACVATFWITAYFVLKFSRTKKKFYFIQDWEPLFYPAGSTAAQTEATYSFGFYGIANTKTLKDIYEQQFGGIAEFFNPAIDSTVFYPAAQDARKPARVFFYARPGHPRNAFELGIAALKRVKMQCGSEVEIVSAGATWNPKQYGVEGIIENLGLMSYQETAELYRKCDIGLLLMFTRHPSYIPFELMASGCAVVSSINPSTAWLMQDGVNCRLAHASASSLSNVVVMLVQDSHGRTALQQAGLRLVREYANWEPQIEKIYDFMCHPESSSQRLGGIS